ncbi:hypothetical protein FSP39_010942 [Pinctada imbricata]|uniref:Uncharacterized protein n=1 Tax=Pinctada imbricata TaxID=66713 RepID=A0AA88YTD6_PINIB|nr:hypothetical protein FSP39_010942 [Pinctada imbricata]
MYNIFEGWEIPTTSTARTTLPPLDPLGGISVHKTYRNSGNSPAEFLGQLLHSKGVLIDETDSDQNGSEDSDSYIPVIEYDNDDDIKNAVVLSDTDLEGI